MESRSASITTNWGEGLLDAGSPDSGGVVRDRGGGDVMPSGDVRERTSAVGQLSVVVEHDPDPCRLQWPEQPVGQLRHDLGRSHPGKR